MDTSQPDEDDKKCLTSPSNDNVIVVDIFSTQLLSLFLYSFFISFCYLHYSGGFLLACVMSGALYISLAIFPLSVIKIKNSDTMTFIIFASFITLLTLGLAGSVMMNLMFLTMCLFIVSILLFTFCLLVVFKHLKPAD